MKGEGTLGKGKDGWRGKGKGEEVVKGEGTLGKGKDGWRGKGKGEEVVKGEGTLRKGKDGWRGKGKGEEVVKGEGTLGKGKDGFVIMVKGLGGGGHLPTEVKSGNQYGAMSTGYSQGAGGKLVLDRLVQLL